MGWELHIVRTENWFNSANDPIKRGELIQLVDNDEEFSIDKKNGDFIATQNVNQPDY